MTLYLILKYDNEEDAPDNLSESAIWLGSHPLHLAEWAIKKVLADRSVEYYKVEHQLEDEIVQLNAEIRRLKELHGTEPARPS